MLKKILPSLLLSCIASGTVAATSPTPTQALQTTDQIIVKLKPTTTSNTRRAVQAAVDSVGMGIHSTYKRSMANGAHIIQLPAPMTLQEASDYATILRADPTVEYAEPDQLMFLDADLIPNDTAFDRQWQYASPTLFPGSANLPSAWGETTGAANVVVAVIDTGVLNHRDLAPRLTGGTTTLAGYDFISNALNGNDGDGRDNDPSDTGDWVSSTDTATSQFSNCSLRNSSWHGTHVAGTIGAISNNAIGVTGVDWNARLLVARTMGKCGGYLSDISDAIRWAAGETVNGVTNPTPAHIINLSLGGTGACGFTYQDAINAATARGTTVVSAAGNTNTNVSNHRPANCQNVVAVTALTQTGSKADFANSGALVDIAAPGVSIYSTLDGGKTTPLNDNAYASYSGSSMAAPHVSGVLALMLAANEHLTDGSIPAATRPSLLEQKLKAAARTFPTGTTSDCTSVTCGTGALDAYRAIMAVKTPPVANAGSNQSVQIGAGVTLQGTGTDNTPGGAITQYRWEQTTGTPVTLSDRSVANPTFVAPATAETLAFRLTVTNNVGLSSSSYSNVTVAPIPPTTTCDPNSLTLGSNTTGHWSSDCASTHRSVNHRARYYTFTLDSAATITANLTSTQQDAYLYLLQGNGKTGTILSANDDRSGSTDSQIVYALPAGTYTLEATTYYASRDGDFSIGITQQVAPPSSSSCTLNALTAGQSSSGQWNNACTSTHRGDAYYANYYTFTLAAAAEVSIALESSQQDTYLFLLEGADKQGNMLTFNDDSNGETHSRIVRKLAAGTYTLEATTYQTARTGAFSIKVDVQADTSACAPQSLTLGNSVTGQWASTCVSTHRGNGYYAAYYTFTLPAPADVTLNLDASTQDTYLYLLTGNDKQGAVITSNDDSNGTSNSQITRSLAAGTYTLEATTYLAGRTGAFSVQVR